jgi:hypothetical protein
MNILNLFRKKTKQGPKRIIDAEAHGLDSMFEDAARLVLKMSYYSESYLQRELNIGYNQALRITIELENAGIVGPIIEPMVPKEILINDEKELDVIMSNIQKNGFHPDNPMSSITDEETKRKIDEIKQNTIEVNSTNYRDYCPFDIAAFSYQEGVAEWKGFSFVTINGNVFHAHRDMKIVELFTICPLLSECKFGIGGAKAVPENYSYFYLGAGNHLFVNDVIADEVKERIKSMDKNDLRQQWEFVVIKALENRMIDEAEINDKGKSSKISKILSGKAFFVTQFKGGWNNEWPDSIILFLSKGKMQTDDDLFFYNSKNEVPREIRGGSTTVKISADSSIEGPIIGETDGEISGRLLVAAGFNNFRFYEIDFSKIDSSIDEFQYIIIDYQNAFREPRKMLSYPSFKIKAIKFPQYISNKKDYGEFLSEMVPQIMDENNCLLYDTNLYKEDFSSILVGRFIRVNTTNWRYESKWEAIDFGDYVNNRCSSGVIDC